MEPGNFGKEGYIRGCTRSASKHYVENLKIDSDRFGVSLSICRIAVNVAS